MSKERMQDVFQFLDADGWILHDPQAMFTAESDRVTWMLDQPRMNTTIHLDFYLLDDLDGRADSLNDIGYCDVRERGIRLSFAKRNTEGWRDSLVEFIRAVRSSVKNELPPDEN